MNTTASSVVAATSSVVAATDPTALLNTQLSSALSTLGDAQFWEETISPATVRNELSTTDPSNPNSTPTLQRGMKWLLASISKGRDVSDFYPHVVKLVGATSLEVRKMVFMYLVQYADHDATTRELSLLSINSFQRGLADHEQLIRGLALRVLSSIRIQDILQIQILGVQKCAKDSSPYVRKCAANALSKLSPRCDIEQREMLLEIMKNLLEVEASTMVLTSVLIAFAELCPERLDFMHSSFRKICHLLTDMDEWGQVVVIEILARYCRVFFKEPRAWKHGTAEKIDRERRVSRGTPKESRVKAVSNGNGEAEEAEAQMQQALPSNLPKRVRRRIVRKGFYSDDEDSSSEEEVYQGPLGNSTSIASAMRQPPILGMPNVDPPIHVSPDAKEDMDLDEDHRLLLDSSMPLLKSRNAGVVLSVCSLHYYCGVSSVKARSAIGRALVRIHRDRREIQYVVLTSIQTLVQECPSAFSPFLPDFFVKALDPPFTRLIKIDILTSLALEPAAIEAVLKEMRMYIRSADTKFVSASIRAVGKVVELSRIVYDREALKSGNFAERRRDANRIALDCLHGLAVTTQNSDNHVIVGEAISVMQNILLILADSSSGDSNVNIDDPNGIQGYVLRRSLLLLLKCLSSRAIENVSKGDPEDSDEDNDGDESKLEDFDVTLPAKDAAAAMWLTGEWMTNVYYSSIELRGLDGDAKARARLEVGRMIAGSFPKLEEPEKQQAIHFATKVILSIASGTIVPLSAEIAICEHILALGRVDVNPDVKDRARFESSLLHVSIGLKHDTSAIEILPSFGSSLSLQQAKQVVLDKRLVPSFLPVNDLSQGDAAKFRFGTLSSLVGHKARDAYIPLPPWGEKNSAKSLRDPNEDVPKATDGMIPKTASNTSVPAGGFYDSDSASSESSSDSSSSSSSSSAWSGSDSDETDSDSDTHNPKSNNPGTIASETALGGGLLPMESLVGIPSASQPKNVESFFNDDSSESDGSDSSASTSSSSAEPSPNVNLNTNNDLLSAQVDLLRIGNQSSDMNRPVQNQSSCAPSAIDDLRGLVMAPIAVPESADETSRERDTSSWMQLVRPELCCGLAARARYLRGKAREREVKLAGLDPVSSAVICVQIQFKNKKNDDGSLRRVKILPRSSSKGGIAIKRTVCPPEIPELKKGQMSTAHVCTQFTSASNREGDMVIRLDIKSSSGGVPVEIKPRVGELLRACNMNVVDFDSTLSKMHGFQRVSASFAVNPGNVDALITAVFKETALNPVGPAKFDDGSLRLVAQLPASDDLVLGLIECDRVTGAGKVTTCCDHAVAGNSILSTLKQAITRLG
mmetsp:Transcript_35278/g.85545  ORF Transcript_35278/g.85545 Transcript_35278/m.85545 type:complete len:1320 (+) Transcript_35278:50-4009(+)